MLGESGVLILGTRLKVFNENSLCLHSMTGTIFRGRGGPAYAEKDTIKIMNRIIEGN